MWSELDDGNEDAGDGDQGRHRPPEIGIHALIGLVNAAVNRSYLVTQVLDLFAQRAVGLVDSMVNRSYLITQVLDLFTQRAVGLVDSMVSRSYLIMQVLDLFT